MEQIRVEIMAAASSKEAVHTGGGSAPMAGRLNMLIMPLAGMLLVIGIWALLSHQIGPTLPNPAATLSKNWELIRDPFFDKGPNNKGIGWQLLYSLGRVGTGFSLALLIGIPAGFLIGTSERLRMALDPIIQILKPVSPLAWLPIGLATFKAAGPAAIFVILITSIWPIIINTAFGVSQINKDYLAVARILRLSRWQTMRKIIFPATLPYMFTGIKISLGVAWLVIVAVEMLTGGIGIGFFVWDEWNNLNLEHIILAILVIGGTGLVLDRMVTAVTKRYEYAV